MKLIKHRSIYNITAHAKRVKIRSFFRNVAFFCYFDVYIQTFPILQIAWFWLLQQGSVQNDGKCWNNRKNKTLEQKLFFVLLFPRIIGFKNTYYHISKNSFYRIFLLDSVNCKNTNSCREFQFFTEFLLSMSNVVNVNAVNVNVVNVNVVSGQWLGQQSLFLVSVNYWWKNSSDCLTDCRN